MRPRLTGFSLVESALSLAIVSFAITAIMGLFPVALRTARESNRETRATLIARRIVDELQSLPATNTGLVRGASLTNSDARITGLDNLLLYDEQGEGLPNQLAPESFPNPLNEPGAYFATEVRVTPNLPRPGISRVQTTVEAPSSAPSSRRSRFVFVTFISQR
jgi:type II secretory pathway pseudopilin PulG